jgi:hypothetical protein
VLITGNPWVNLSPPTPIPIQNLYLCSWVWVPWEYAYGLPVMSHHITTTLSTMTTAITAAANTNANDKDNHSCSCHGTGSWAATTVSVSGAL